jgi:hypothetical protein
MKRLSKLALAAVVALAFGVSAQAGDGNIAQQSGKGKDTPAVENKTAPKGKNDVAPSKQVQTQSGKGKNDVTPEPKQGGKGKNDVVNNSKPKNGGAVNGKKTPGTNNTNSNTTNTNVQ